MNRKVRLVVLLIVIGLFVNFGFKLSNKTVVTTIGDDAFNFKLPDLNKKNVRLSDYKEQIVILNFFTTWCNPCKEEAPELEKFEKEFGKEYKLLIIDRGETPERVQKFIKKYKTTSTYLFDYNMKISKKYGVTGQPETFIIDRSGIIREHYNGPLTKDELYQMVKKYD
ncbi:TlpA family protein disulfide reductase [Neobacillus notoginsengisoli]|uniref:TlpA family protein disulfide reductase n=1 Tax=Neobacillus notoginsengisoli TaxID=1578198 RepID=A0A417YPY4_9BACI|nr:TlpA disulfide reductase family protein [Neobacillus notoginsengisoli]RHW36055.1 TlpA family protein disulfide reductase [Neobacillus notoginsengisoli]